MRVLLSPIFVNRFISGNHSDWGELISQSHFNFAFPWWLEILNTFKHSYWQFVLLFWKVSIQFTCLFLNRQFHFLGVKFLHPFVNCEHQPLSGVVGKAALPRCGLSVCPLMVSALPFCGLSMCPLMAMSTLPCCGLSVCPLMVSPAEQNLSMFMSSRLWILGATVLLILYWKGSIYPW